MALDPLSLFGLFLLLRDFLGGKASSSSTTSRTAPVPVPVPTPTPAPVEPVKATDVQWPANIPSVEPTKPGEPLAMPASIPWAPMPYDKSAPPAMMRTGPVTAVTQSMSMALAAREAKPYEKSYWQAATHLTSAQIARANALLKEWAPDKAPIFEGDRTWTTRTQYRFTKHGSKKAVEVWMPKPPFV